MHCKLDHIYKYNTNLATLIVDTIRKRYRDTFYKATGKLQTLDNTKCTLNSIYKQTLITVYA